MITEADITNWFTYHSPSVDDQENYVAIRDKARELALVILNRTPPSVDQSASIRLLREAVMTANASIACNGR